MRADICVHLNRQVFNDHAAFRLASDSCLRSLAVEFSTTHCAPGDLIFHIGESVDTLCFVISGSLEVIQDDEVIAILGKGDVFGDVFWKESTLARACANVRALTYCDLHVIRRDPLLRVLEFYTAFASSFSRNLLLTCNLRKRVIFRKIADVKREEERQRNEVALSIPEDHPVRKLFQRFRQQRDGQTPDYCDHNCVQIEPQDHNSSDHNSAPAQASPTQVHREAAAPDGSAGKPSLEAPVQSPAPAVSLRGGAKGWAKFKSAPAAPPAAPPAQKSLGPDQTAAGPQASEASVDRGPKEESSLHKTDSCDSGITKSDLRIDHVGSSRSSSERSPLEPQSAAPAQAESQLHSSLQEAKAELKGDIQRLGHCMSALELQVGHILRLLTTNMRLSLPPSLPPQPAADLQDSASTPSPAEDESTSF
ncbi:unnamed protein product [Knipowitschia caucasica]|uniref:Cyclic nucleotide-binding domain-containing protein n=1 Tax=Knipowitschia caucasica TaxID=637954 RepID=A0AAV2KFX9_KNICA